MSIIFNKFKRDLSSELPKIAVSILIISMGIGGFITFFQVSENIKTTVFGGEVGIIFDCRGRPLSLSKQPEERISELNNWSDAVNEYPSIEI